MKVACERIAAIIADYRSGEIPAPDAAHVERWISQFPPGVRDALLSETAHLLQRTYASEKSVADFLRIVTTQESLVGPEPAAWWRGVRFLRLQPAGDSQRFMLAAFDSALRQTCGLSIDECGRDPHTFAYLDDAVFSGGRVGGDLSRWISTEAPASANVAVIVMARHRLGEFFAGNDIRKAAAAAGKSITLAWWRTTTFEDRKAHMAMADVLRPTAIPPEAAAYVESLGAAPVLRTGSGTGRLGLFSSGAARALIEREFLKAGIAVRDKCPLLPAQMRPLGCSLLKTTGFGSMFVTHRNCANNTPLVLWAGDPWYPLLPRRIN